MTRTRVLIVDDHAVVRRGVKEILEETGDIVVSGEAVTGSEAIKHVSENAYDAVILDISMPGKNGLDVLKDIKLIAPGLPVLVLSMHPEEQYAVRAFKCGASGYVTKGSVPAELVQAVRKVIGGGKYVSSSFAESLADRIEGTRKEPLHERLSDRELEIMLLIAAGKGIKEIGARLSLSPKTVTTYRRRLLDKTGMRNNSELTSYVERNNLDK